MNTNKIFLKLLSLIGFLFMAACTANTPNHNVEVVSPAEFRTMLSEDSNAYLLDVRKPDEYKAGHLENAQELDWLDTDNFKQQAPNIDKSKTVYVYCRSGRRSKEAADFLAGEGYKVVDLDGGILAWEENGLPVVTEVPDEEN